MKRWLTAIMALFLSLPSFGAVEYAYDEADQSRVTRLREGSLSIFTTPYTNRATSLTQQEITDFTFDRQVANVPRSTKVTAVGLPSSIIWGGTHDNTKGGGWYNSTLGASLYFKGVDPVRNRVIASTGAGKVYSGEVGTSSITWTEILDYATYGGVFDDVNWAYDTDFMRYLYAVKVVGNVMTLYFGLQDAAQPSTPGDITDDLCKVYSGTWDGAAWGSWTGAMTSEYGTPAETWSIDQRDSSLVWGSYNHLDHSDYIGYYISSDGGLTWTELFVIQREYDDTEGFKVHCHGCTFGSSVDEVFAAHGDNAAPLRHFQKIAGTWTLVGNRLQPFTATTTTIDVGGIAGVTLNTVDPVFHSLMYSATFSQGLSIAVGDTPEVRSIAGVTDNNTVTLDASVTKAAGEAVSLLVPEVCSSDRLAYLSGKLYCARHGANINPAGNPDTFFYIDGSTWKITNTQMIPDYYGDTNSPYRSTANGNPTAQFYLEGLLFGCYPAFGTDRQRTGFGLYCSADGKHWTPLMHDVNEVLTGTVILRGVRGIMPMSITNTAGRRVLVGVANRGLKAISTTLDGIHTDTNIVDTVGAIWDKVYVGCTITIATAGDRVVTGFTDTTTVTVNSNYSAAGGVAVTLSAQSQAEVGFVMPAPVARTVDGFLVQKGGINDFGGGTATHDYLWSLEAGTETPAGNGWGIGVYPMITPDAGVDISNTNGSHGSKSIRVFTSGDAGTPSTYMCYGEIKGPVPPRTPVSDEKITFLFYAKQTGEPIQYTVPNTYGGTYLYIPASNETHYVGENWQRIFAHYRWKANGLNTEFRIDTARWVANMLKTSATYFDCATLVFDQYRWYTHSLEPYWSGNLAATRTWPDEWVVLPMPSATTSYTLNMDWFPLEPCWNFLENIPIYTLRGASGAYMEVGWVDTTDGTNPAKLYATDGTTTKYTSSPVRFLHWDDIKISVTFNAGVPTTMYVWDANGDWQNLDLTSGTDLVTLGKCESLELGTDADHTASAGNHAAVGSGRYANVRLHATQLPESSAKAAAMDVTAKSGTSQLRVGVGGGGLYMNPNE